MRGDGIEMGGPGGREVVFPGEKFEARWLPGYDVLVGFGVGVHFLRVREREGEETLGAGGLVDRRTRNERRTERAEWQTVAHFSALRFVSSRAAF